MKKSEIWNKLKALTSEYDLILELKWRDSVILMREELAQVTRTTTRLKRERLHKKLALSEQAYQNRSRVVNARRVNELKQRFRKAWNAERYMPLYNFIRNNNAQHNIEAVGKADYRVQLNMNMDNFTMDDAVKMIDRIIVDSKLLQKLKPTDKIRVAVDFPDGRASISTKLQTVKDFNAVKFFESFSKVFQSVSAKDDLLSFASLTYKFVYIKMPVGGSYLKIIHNMDIYKKKCVIAIKNTDDLCMARSIVTAHAVKIKHEKIK
jgi:hypothetical protein